MTSRTLGRIDRHRLRTGVAALAVAVAITGSATAVARADQMVGKYMVKGQIETAYFATGGVATWGPPTGPDSAGANGGRYQVFKNNVAFYTNPKVDGGNAHSVGGAIRAKWGQEGAERGKLGYPTSDELQARTPFTSFTGQITGAMNNFQGGVIYWSPGAGAWPVQGGILNKWTTAKRESGQYGYPVGPEIKTSSGWSQQFQKGNISFP